MSVELFKCNDGDQWYSVVENGDIVTGEMHATAEAAQAEMETLQS